ncbi:MULTISPECIES: hypothetical protein [Paraclostridium]|jgi:hypothetical protein|uniref:Uncharacterized protein n=1 Tax=Paraclostridium bifermentans ATCC 638 = DSM 14991 TaxID=1233171 RepID=T4VGF5_PARBF|nr:MULTISPECIES: hypothetical protein [Paraclostridium]MDV8116204.1 hypothetical protein [Bacillus sp. BAU-SS-2023]RDC48538.1 hypothetical protein DVA85_28415 [Acinetobacter sp. RIT592]EQK39479.1 hypothetical protein C671_3080 [[Clostridium] bifermentans ATCC 19299] [Paraclostridium bifermentans ATCC 19299]EQK42799.1 hypothetical protein C672_1743 [[Clostridium] bifermentans ATCC 638] [Paraclostridium bifermentans ATCC 638 = DSM 14991]MBU5286648.1 hypothetical protein [Paraclostridium bifermen
MSSNVYVVIQKDLGYMLTINESSITCDEFRKTCDAIVGEFGKDVFILHQKLIEVYGFEKASIQCTYMVE